MHTAVYIAWGVLLLVWLAGMIGSKRTARQETLGDRALHVFGSVLAFSLLFGDEPGPEPYGGWTGLALTMAGVAVAIWARVTLGTNWSATVTVKENHELIRKGPYLFVRHPIYAGALLAILGTALAFGEVRGLLGFLVALVTWKRKSLTEERFMLEQFGPRYEQYRREVKALIPGLW